MAQRRRPRDAAQQEHDGCVDGVLRVQPVSECSWVGTVAFFLWALLNQLMRASYAIPMQCLATLTMLQSAFNNDAEQACLLVSCSSSRLKRAKYDPTEV